MLKFHSLQITLQFNQPMVIDAGIEKGAGYIDMYLFFGPIVGELFFWRDDEKERSEEMV